MSRVRLTFQLELPIKTVFDTPTVAGMGTIIEQNQTNPGSEDKIDRVLSEIEAMTEVEAQRSVDEK